MDKVTKYQNAIIALLEEYAAIKPKNMPNLVRNTFPKFDEEPISPSALKKYPFNE